MYHSVGEPAIYIGFLWLVDYNAHSEPTRVEERVQCYRVSRKFEIICLIQCSRRRNLPGKHDIKAVRSLKAVLAPQSAAA